MKKFYIHYENIRSKFVKNKLKGLQYTPKNCQYIRDLLDIECCFGKHRHSFKAVMPGFEKEYPVEFRGIGREMNKKYYFEYLKNKKKWIKESKKDAKDADAATIRTWKYLGGKV